jgi:hypothetical protein
MNDAPKRSHELVCSIGADTQDDLIRALHDFADRIARGEITHGCSGGWNYGTIYSYKHDPSITHDSYFESLKAHLAKERAASAN